MFAPGGGVFGQAVALVLFARAFGGLCKVGLEFDSSNRQPVDEEAQIDRQLAAGVVLQLGHNAQPIGGIACDDRLVALIFGRCLRHVDLPAARDGKATAQNLNGALFRQGGIEAGEQRFAGAFAVQGNELVPFWPLGLLDPGLQILGVDGGVLVKAFGVAKQPALCRQLFDDIGL